MESMELRKERKLFKQRVRNGGLVFYICAFATVLNLVLYYVNFPVMMPTGLHSTRYWFAEHASEIGMSPALGAVLTVLAAAVFALAGYFGREKGNYWVYSIGTVVFALDILNVFAPGAQSVFSSTGDLMSSYDSGMIVLFDLYGVILLIMGIRAMRKVNEIDRKVKDEGMTPIPDDDDPVRDMTDEQRREYEAEKKKKGFLARRQQEESVVSIDPSAAWPEPAKNAKRAKAARIAQEDEAADAFESSQDETQENSEE